MTRVNRIRKADKWQSPRQIISRPSIKVQSPDGDRNPPSLPPFPPQYRASGVLLHVTSLPSPYGIGDVGPAAMKWIDLLHEAGQSWWQSLPLGPTGYGNSPYQSLSSFAGNGLLISPDWLIEDGLVVRGRLCIRPNPPQTPLILTRLSRSNTGLLKTGVEQFQRHHAIRN